MAVARDWKIVRTAIKSAVNVALHGDTPMVETGLYHNDELLESSRETQEAEELLFEAVRRGDDSELCAILDADDQRACRAIYEATVGAMNSLVVV